MAIKQGELKDVGEIIADSKARVTLARALKELGAVFGDRKVRFHVSIERSTGRIVLTPAVTVPLREAWLYENPKALKTLRSGVAQAGRGQVVKRGSFAKHADDDAG